MLLDGHSAPSGAENLGRPHTALLDRWKAQLLDQEGAAASAREARGRQLEEQLRRTERERDLLKKRWPFSAREPEGGYPVLTQLQPEGFPIAVVGQALGVRRAGYYAHAQGGAGPRAQEDARLRPLVRQIFWEHKRR